ncbi:MAG: anti-anti-sigma factor [Sphingobacteriales bacterium]|nr:anti-anti-sigma factor [Sphingobacteriales bacterium]
MNVKIDTREKFHVVTPLADTLSANMTAELTPRLLALLQTPEKNVVLKMKEVTTVEPLAGEDLLKIQQQFYENNTSFVICELTEKAEQLLDASGLLEDMNHTPTESEAWDIVQMEEIEREMMDNWDDTEV